MIHKLSKLFTNNLEKIYYILGEGLSKGGSLLLFPFFTYNLSKSEFGQLSLYWACIPFLSIFIDFCQRNYIKRVYLDDVRELKNSLIAVSSFCAIMFVFFLLIHFGFGLFDFYIIDSDFDLFLIFTAFLFTLIEFQFAILQMGGKAKIYSIIYGIKVLTPYLLTVLIFTFHGTFFLYAFPLIQIGILAILSGLFLHQSFTLKDVKKAQKKLYNILKKSLKFGAPLILGTLSATGLNVADRIMISFTEGDPDVANYTVAYTIASILIAFYMATNKWWQRFMLMNLKNNKIREIRNVFWKYFGIVFCLFVFLFLTKDYLIILFAGEEYKSVVKIIPTLMIGMLFYFLYTIFLNVPFYYGNSFYIILPALVAFLVNIVLNFILIPIKGYEIAALTTAISYFVEFTIIYIVNLKVYKIDIFLGRTRLKSIE